MSRLLTFDRIDETMVAAVGGKAANLGRLTRAGLPVPGGFCLTTDGYRAVVGDLLTPLLPALSAEQPAEAHRAAARARELIVRAPVPVELAADIAAGYDALGAASVAVRSSATTEDLDFASFAGQQDTYLNVRGTADLLDAVRRCWASLWTDRAVSYRNSQHVSHQGVALAVVVQQMVQSVAAGVLFTANPVTGHRGQTVIDASPGLGEAVVSGLVNPDHFVVDSATGQIVDRRLGDKRVLIRSRTQGGTERIEREVSDDQQAITDEQVRALTALGGRVQEHYGAPQDTEWALDEQGTLWLTQARPVTTLYPLPDRDVAGRVYLCLTLAQGLTRPITPMGLAAFRLIGSCVATAAGAPPADPFHGPPALAIAGQRVFVDFTDALLNPVGRRVALAASSVMEARAAAVIRHLITWPELARATGSRVTAVRVLARILTKVRLPQRALLAACSPRRAYRAIAALEQQLRIDLELPEDATPTQRLDHVERLLSERVIWFMPTVIAYPAAGFALLAAARWLLSGLLQPGDLQTVLRGLPHNVTTEMDLELWRLSRRIGDDAPARAAFLEADVSQLAAAFRSGRLPDVAQRGLTGFLARYGHRAVAEIDPGMPRWSDDPTHLVGVLANYLRHQDPGAAPDVMFAAADTAAQQMLDVLVGRARQRSRIRARAVAFGLRRARQLTGLRESPKNLLVLALAGVRHQLQLVGRSLAAAGSLGDPDDIFFLDLREARQGLTGGDLRQLVRERRSGYAAELNRRHIPRVLLSDGTEPETLMTAAHSVAGALVGSAASAGTVTGPARVILDPVGAQLEPGEILVAPSTDPGWTPLFLTAGGLVMEMGGPNSHGAVVAREYGIPAVVGVPEATSTIATGDVVTVDGAAGLVLRPG